MVTGLPKVWLSLFHTKVVDVMHKGKILFMQNYLSSIVVQNTGIALLETLV